MELLVIMNSAFKFFTELISYLNKLSESGIKRLKIRIQFVKITTYHLDASVVDIEKVWSMAAYYIDRGASEGGVGKGPSRACD